MAAEVDFAVIEAVRNVTDPLTLRIIEALAHEKSENNRLKGERAWLERRIAEEDARLANA